MLKRSLISELHSSLSIFHRPALQIPGIQLHFHIPFPTRPLSSVHLRSTHLNTRHQHRPIMPSSQPTKRIGISLHPATPLDIASFTRIEIAAFSSHPRWGMLFPNCSEEEISQYYSWTKNKTFKAVESGERVDARLVKAVDERTGEVVGCATWSFELGDSGGKWSEGEVKENGANGVEAKGKEDGDEKPPELWPRNGNWAMRTFYKKEWEKFLAERFPGQGFVCLDILVVDPTQQKRGIGAQLVQWGVDEADRLGLPMCLESSPTGWKLYKRFGFKEVRFLKADMKDFGWMEEYDEDAAARIWMVREAASPT